MILWMKYWQLKEKVQEEEDHMSKFIIYVSVEEGFGEGSGAWGVESWLR